MNDKEKIREKKVKFIKLLYENNHEMKKWTNKKNLILIYYQYNFFIYYKILYINFSIFNVQLTCLSLNLILVGFFFSLIS